MRVIMLLVVLGTTLAQTTQNPNWELYGSVKGERHHVVTTLEKNNPDETHSQGYQLVLPKPGVYQVSCSSQKKRGSVTVKVTKDNTPVVVVATWATSSDTFVVLRNGKPEGIPK